MMFFSRLKLLNVCLSVLICFMLTGCSRVLSTQTDYIASLTKYKPSGNSRYDEAMRRKMDDYAVGSVRYFTPFFARQGLPLINDKLAFVVLKKEHRLQIYAQHKGRWHFITWFKVVKMSGVSGPKLKEGDLQVPEGIYKVIYFNPLSNNFLSMKINYPNRYDRKKAALTGRTNLGGEIFIHGNDRSVGCVAIGDKAVSLLFPLTVLYSLANGPRNDISVIITPYDFRLKAVHLSKNAVPWEKDLYSMISQRLSEFPLPSFRQRLLG